MRYAHRYTVTGLVGLFVGLAELLLTARVLLRFFNGNPDAQFVSWVYRNTEALLEPLRNMFPMSWNDVGPGWNIDFPALFAMAAYAVLGALLISLAGKLAMKDWMLWNNQSDRSKRR